jgi:hypothetical protein
MQKMNQMKGCMLDHPLNLEFIDELRQLSTDNFIFRRNPHACVGENTALRNCLGFVQTMTTRITDCLDDSNFVGSILPVNISRTKIAQELFIIHPLRCHDAIKETLDSKRLFLCRCNQSDAFYVRAILSRIRSFSGILIY